jgi:hypothetical protein
MSSSTGEHFQLTHEVEHFLHYISCIVVFAGITTFAGTWLKGKGYEKFAVA